MNNVEDDLLVDDETGVYALESFRQHPYKTDIFLKVVRSMKFFPELKNQKIYLGISGWVKKNEKNIASADFENNILMFNVNREISYVTVFHELMHFVQYQSNLPRTEEYCSIYAMARMPPHLVDQDIIPYIGKGHKSYNADLCRESVNYRENGHRKYIQYLKNRLMIENRKRI